MDVVRSAGQRFFPLDEELGLLPGRYTPRLQEAMTRLGSKLPFREAVEEIESCHRTKIGEATVRRTTHENGRACEAAARQEVEEIEASRPEVPVQGENLAISVDGAFIGLTGGDWREVKTLAIGEFGPTWNAKKGEIEVKSTELSYFSRSYPIREFERYALGELHRRGLEKAKKVVAVNDGSEWIQSFIDYHCPKCVRIIDFPHALSYVGIIGKAILGEETEAFKSWFKDKSRELKEKPPDRLLSELSLFGKQAESIEQEAAIDQGLGYLSRRQEMIDYPSFRYHDYPIASGSVESSHKHVVHKRLKQAGMRWAGHHVDPLLSLRNLICNDRWEEGWQQLVAHRQQKRWASPRHPEPEAAPPPITLDSVRVAPEPSASPLPTPDVKTPKERWRPPPDHPWRRPFLLSRN